MSGGSGIKASIVIPTAGRAGLLAEVLRAMERQTGDFEVVVVCDGEDGPTRSLSRTYRAAFPLRWIFCPENRGQSAARNLGAEHAGGEVLVFLDDDTFPAPGWLQAHLQHHAGQGGPVVLGRLIHEYESPPGTGVERMLRESADRVQAGLELTLTRMGTDAAREYWVGLNSSLPVALFRESGGFDTALRHVEEDAELAARMLGLGVKFAYEPDAVVHHMNTKDLAGQHVFRASLFAETDLYRLMRKKQKSAGWPMLASLHDSRGAQRLKHRLSWRLPRLASAIGGLCRIGGEALGAEFLLRQWSDLAFMTRYWGRVKAEGLSLDDVRRLLES